MKCYFRAFLVFCISLSLYPQSDLIQENFASSNSTGHSIDINPLEFTDAPNLSDFTNESIIELKDTTEILYGIWDAEDRIIAFDNSKELDNNFIFIYLKTFYNWYLDKVASSTSRNNDTFDVNNTVFLDIQNIKVNFIPLLNSSNCNAYEIVLTYPKSKEKTYIPIAIIDDKLYLDFMIKSNSLNYIDVNDNELSNSYSSVCKVGGIKVSKPYEEKFLTSVYIKDNYIYYIRYWKTDMTYSSEKASFTDGVNKYFVPKHIKSCGNVFTCVNGRSLVIRNVEKKQFNSNNDITDSSENIITFSKPYMINIDKDFSKQKLDKIATENNSKKFPIPQKVFPDSNLDYHIEDITRIEINNQIIQAVRKRQREFYEKYKNTLHY